MYPKPGRSNLGISTGSKREGVSQAPLDGVSGAPRIALLDVVGSLALAVALALSYPVLDLLSRNLAFFTAHQTVTLDVLGLALLLTIVIPLVVPLPVVILMRLAPRAGVVAYALVLGLLGAATVLPFVERLIDTPWLVVAVALVLGVLVVVACLRVLVLQTLLRWGAVVPGVVLALFVFASPASGLIFVPDTALQETLGVGNPVPVVVLVLDELPVQTLMDAEGNIDASRYPGFASLLDDFTWFRNAATMYSNTHEVLPVILSSSPNQPGVEPTASGYPNNLFSLLGSGYDVWAHEEVTGMCRPEVCPEQHRPGVAERWTVLLSDVSIVGAHVVLPDEATSRLPTLAGTWTGFASSGGEQSAPRRPHLSEDERTSTFDEFLNQVEEARPQSLHFFHILDPHHPWNALPGGLKYPGDVGIPLEEPVWGDDQYVADQAHQRHILQTGFVDDQVRRFVEVLRGTGTYDDTLVMVMADHGVAFRAGGYYRGGTKDNIEEIAYIPLFVKAPGQKDGSIDDRPASLYDVLPTVVDVLDVETSWSMTGTSLLEETPDSDRERLFGGIETVALPPTHPPIDDSLRRKLGLFGSGNGWDSVYSFGPHRDLVGQAIASTEVDSESAEVLLVDPTLYDNIDPASGIVPALVRASVSSANVTAQTWLAVAVNGTIAATGRVHDWTPQVAEFSVIVAPTSFVTGKNEIAFYRIEESNGEPILHHLEDR
jgi:Sulfatase